MPGSPERPPRPRGCIAIAILAVIPLGLLTRADLPLPTLIAAFGGDTLYATVVYLLVALIWPRAAIGRFGMATLGRCVAIEQRNPLASVLPPGKCGQAERIAAQDRAFRTCRCGVLLAPPARGDRPHRYEITAPVGVVGVEEVHGRVDVSWDEGHLVAYG